MTRTTRAIQVLTVLFVALTMGLEFAHVLERGPRFGYPPELYVRLTNTLYFWFGTVGGLIYVLSIFATAALTWLVRRRGRTIVALTGTAAALQLTAQITWLALILPVNLRFHALAPGEVPADFTALRAQWEYTHALGFVLFTAAFLLLVTALLVRPARRPGTDEPSTRLAESVR